MDEEFGDYKTGEASAKKPSHTKWFKIGTITFALMVTLLLCLGFKTSQTHGPYNVFVEFCTPPNYSYSVSDLIYFLLFGFVFYSLVPDIYFTTVQRNTELIFGQIGWLLPFNLKFTFMRLMLAS